MEDIMCGRYYLADFEEEDIREYIEILEALNKRIKKPSYSVNMKTSGEVFPTDTVPVIANNKGKDIRAFAMEWGYSLTNGNRIINARSETASQKPMFRDGMMRRRCIVPASYYFEWEKQQGIKIKHAIHPAGNNAMFMAGIYRMEQNKPVFCILTRSIAPDIAFIHDRMPVILDSNAQKHGWTWIVMQMIL